jgi:hypothetical protein
MSDRGLMWALTPGGTTKLCGSVLGNNKLIGSGKK